MRTPAPEPDPWRASLTGTLDRIRPLDSLEAAHRDFALDWAGSGAPLYRTRKPAIPPVHLVSYFVMTDSERCQLLLVDHRAAGLWLPPGGHVDPADSGPWETVRRECQEELRVRAEPMAATGTEPFFVSVARTRGAGSHTDVSLWYAVQASARDITDYDHREFERIGWFTPRQILAMPADIMDPHLHRGSGKLAALAGLA
jgi:8-oxo-dGTP pyrophosphatase MutT (NUDIX family)